MDFSECNLQESDFRYANFRKSIFKQASLANSSLERARFRNSSMDGCILDNCSIHEADFSNASLKKSSFLSAKAKVGLTDDEEWQFVGFLPVSFRDSDLTGADFTNADLTGADFSGAVLTDTVFTGAILNDAVFSNSIKQLSNEQQRRTIILSNCSIPHSNRGNIVTTGSFNADTRQMSQPRYTSYFVMEQLDNVPSIPSPKITEVQKISNLMSINGIDYFSRYGLISDSLKKLMEIFMPGYNFELAAYLDSAKPVVTALWILNPQICSDFEAVYRTDGHVSHLALTGADTPRIFIVKSPKGIRSLIIHLAVAESMLRRNICGLKLTRILEYR